MIISFFESFKYLGHLWPIALLRVYVGIFFINSGIENIKSKFLVEPVLRDVLNKWIEMGAHREGYVHFMQNWVSPHWQVFSYFVVFSQVFVGLSYTLGFMVRPAALIAIFLNINFMFAASLEGIATNKVLIAVNMTLLLVSAGRCFGFDYYFYKRVRGIWW